MECDKTALTTNKKIMVISLYNYFQKNKHYKNTNLHKEVVLATGVSERTIDHILAEYDKNKEFKPPKYEHHLFKKHQAEYTNAIRDFIFSANKSGTLLSIQILVLELSNLGFSVSLQQYWKGIEVEIDNQSDDDYDKNLGASDSDLD
ncbi:11431_t:CDS:2 [Gigaspora margarita]|uniref:11431_t:CDS:1 n=1 Tax=Gigaspora margarita TaxID=4874 RepID=A0ABN7VK06_GIGMA|nr:11431_t:CDS:2 [Gigaspora margarita]